MSRNHSVPFYGKDCPAAVVYHVSWPDERIVSGVLGDIGEKSREAELGQTSLIIVGRALLRDFPLAIVRCRFQSRFPSRTIMKTALIALSTQGALLARRIAQALPDADIFIHTVTQEAEQIHCRGTQGFESIVALTGKIFGRYGGLVYIVPCGVAVGP